MRKDADRYGDGEDDYYDATPDLGAAPDPDAYWRRRFFILGGGIAVVGLCVWLFPGGHHAAPRTSSTARASMAALDKKGELSAAAYGSTWPSPTPKPTPTPTPSVTRTPAKTNRAKPATSAYPNGSQSPTPSASASAGGVKGPRCAPADIVLSLFTGQPSYGQGASPEFDVYAVSTSSTACALSYGPGSVQVVVTRQGRVVWDSAACKLSGAAAVRFTLGVPQMLSIAWNRQAKSPSGCAGTLSAGASGTFDAVALTDGQSSPVRSFSLTR
jgi:hypothetical protein